MTPGTSLTEHDVCLPTTQSPLQTAGRTRMPPIAWGPQQLSYGWLMEGESPRERLTR